MNLSNPFEFKCPARLLFGIDICDNLGDEIKALNGSRPLVVTDKGIVNAGLMDRISELLKQAAIEFVVFDEVEENPTVATVHKGADLYKSEKCDIIIGLGGGSSMDAGKAIGVKATHEGEIQKYTRRGGHPIKNIVPPYIAIPTTSGTGSEVTWVSVVTDPDIKAKTVVASPFIAPDTSLIDPTLTKTLPPSVTASTGMDALTHAVEGYTSIKASPVTDTLALKAIEMIASNLREAVAYGDNMEARSNMMLGSTIAGIAFGNASVGMVHSVAHALGGLFNIAHGIANAIMLPLVMQFNLIANPPKFGDIAWAMGENIEGLSEMEAARMSVASVQELSDDVGIPTDLKKLGADPSLIEQMTEETENQVGSLPLNPRRPTREDIIQLFENAFAE